MNSRPRIKFRICKWRWVPGIVKEYEAEYTRRRGIRILCFEIYSVTQVPCLQLCDPRHKFVTAEGMILTTESDEQDRMYICNRSRGFEISYHNYEITMKNGKISIYHNNVDILEHIPFEDNTLNQSMKI